MLCYLLRLKIFIVAREKDTHTLARQKVHTQYSEYVCVLFEWSREWQPTISYVSNYMDVYVLYGIDL